MKDEMVAGFVFLSTNKQTCYIGISLHERQPYTGLVSLYPCIVYGM